MYGTKHIITCRCILNQFKNRDNPPLHKFIAFSVVDDDDKVKESFVKCNNCGIIHKITDLCKSEIKNDSDDWQVINKSDIRFSITGDLRDLLDSYDVDLPTWQHALWIIENNLWGSKLILSKKENEERIEGKILIFKELKQYRIETFLDEK